MSRRHRGGRETQPGDPSLDPEAEAQADKAEAEMPLTEGGAGGGSVEVGPFPSESYSWGYPNLGSERASQGGSEFYSSPGRVGTGDEPAAAGTSGGGGSHAGMPSDQSGRHRETEAGGRSDSATTPWKTTASDGKTDGFDAKWAEQQYRNMSQEARQEVDAEADRTYEQQKEAAQEQNRQLLEKGLPVANQYENPSFAEARKSFIRQELTLRFGPHYWELQGRGSGVGPGSMPGRGLSTEQPRGKGGAGEGSQGDGLRGPNTDGPEGKAADRGRVDSEKSSLSPVNWISEKSFDKRWAEAQVKAMSPEARDKLNAAVNTEFEKQRDAKGRETDALRKEGIVAGNPYDDAFYAEKVKSEIADRLATRGRDYWEQAAVRDIEQSGRDSERGRRPAEKTKTGDLAGRKSQAERSRGFGRGAEAKAVRAESATARREAKSRQGAGSGEKKGFAAEKPTSRPEAPRQDKIGEKSHARTGKEFHEFVEKRMQPLSPGDRRNAALDLARNLTPADLKSREMATEHGEKALGIIRDELNAKSVKDVLKALRDRDPWGSLSDLYKGAAEWRDNKILEKALQKDAAAFSQEAKRINDAIRSIHSELHPRQDAAAARRQFNDNFPKLAAEIRAGIEGKGQYRVADVYHRQFAYPDGNSEEIRAKLTETRRVENPKTGRVSEVTTEKDVCLGAVDFGHRNAIMSPRDVEKLLARNDNIQGSYPELVALDALFVASMAKIAAKGALAVGKDLAARAAVRAGDSLAAATAGELGQGGGAVASRLGGALERQAARSTSKEALAGTSAFDRAATRKGVDAFARTEQASVRSTRTFPPAERPTAGRHAPDKTLPPLESPPTGRTLKGWSPEGGPPKGRGTPTEAPLPTDRPPESPVRAGAETGGAPIAIGDAAPKGLGYDTPAGRIEIQRVVRDPGEAEQVRDRVMRGEIPGGWAAHSDDIMQGEWRVAGGKGEAPVGWWEKKGTGGSFVYNRGLVGPESGETARIVGQRVAGAARQGGLNRGTRSPFADRGQAARDLPKSAPRDLPSRGQGGANRQAGDRSPEIVTDKAAAKNRSPEAFAKTQELGPKGTRTFPMAERHPAGRQAADKTLPPLESAPTGRTLGGLGPVERPPAGRPPSGEAPPPGRPPVGGRPPGGDTPTLPPLDVPRTAEHARERLAQYGFDAQTVQAWENQIRARGIPEAEVGRQMNNNADLLDYYARVWNNGDTSNLPRLTWTLEDMGGGGPAASIREAISDQCWVNKVSQYSARHGESMARYYQGEVPRALRRQFSEEADRFARDKVNEFLNRP